MKKSATTALVVGLLGATLIPGVASASQGVIPPLRTTIDPCAKVQAEYRLTVAAARSAKKAAYHAAQSRFHAATSDERTQVQSSGRSSRLYRTTTADERAAREATRLAARSAYQDAIKAAHGQYKAGLGACRG